MSVVDYVDLDEGEDAFTEEAPNDHDQLLDDARQLMLQSMSAMEYESDPFERLIDTVILPKSAIVAEWLKTNNRIVIPLDWYQESYHRILPVLLLSKYTPVLVSRLGPQYGQRVFEYVNQFLSTPENQTLPIMLFEDLIMMQP